MIMTDEDFALVRLQLERVETGLGALRRDVLPKSEARFLLMAEAYVEQILALRAEIDEYLGLELFQKRRAADLQDHQPAR